MVFDYSWYATAELPTVLTGALRRRELRRSEEFAVHIYVLPASYTEDKHRAHLFPWHHLRLQDIVESASEINNSSKNSFHHKTCLLRAYVGFLLDCFEAGDKDSK